MLFVFEDNEVVIKMIIKGRSSTMRHVSRIHIVALDELFDRTNLGSKIQIPYIDTTHPHAHILTKGNFARDEWNNLLRLFNISHFSPLWCTQNFSFTGCPTMMAKRMQEQKEEGRIEAESKLMARKLTSIVSTSSASVNHPITSLNDLDVNNAVWSIFMNVTLEAAVHLGRDYLESLWFTKNQLLKSAKQLFQMTEQLIMDQTEIGGLTTIDFKEPTWRSTALLCDKAIEITNAKTYLRGLGALSGKYQWPTSRSLEEQIKLYLKNRFLKDLNRIDGEPMEVEWTIFPGFTALGILEEIQNFMIELQCEPEQFEGRIIFMSMYNDIIWENGEKQNYCIANAHRVTEYARRFTRGHWSFLGRGSEKKWYGTHVNKPDG